MQAIAVLADEVLEPATILQLHERHVSRRGNGLQGIHRSQVVLAPLHHQRPGALGPSKVSDPSRGRDTGAREDDQVPARADPVREDPRLLVDGGGGLLVLYLGDLGRGVGHFGRVASRARRGWRVFCIAREGEQQQRSTRLGQR